MQRKGKKFLRMSVFYFLFFFFLLSYFSFSPWWPPFLQFFFVEIVDFYRCSKGNKTRGGCFCEERGGWGLVGFRIYCYCALCVFFGFFLVMIEVL